MLHDISVTSLLIIQCIILVFSLILIYYLLKAHRIRTSKTHLESAFDSIDDPLAIISSDYQILRVNKAYAALVGKTYLEAIGKKCYLILRGRAKPCEDCLMAEVFKTVQRQNVQYSTHPKAPEDRTISITFYPFTERAHDVPSIVEHIRDTTELELLKGNLEKQNKILSDTTSILRHTQREINEELQMARLVQQSTLPQHTPEMAGIKMAVTYHPIEAVGGDVYDFIPFGDHRLGVFIGDASGHGMPASLVSTISKMSLYNHTKKELPTNDLLLHINSDLIGNVRTGHYMTCFWGIFDTRDNSLIYSRAGHPMPIVIRASGEVVQLDSVGMFAGIMENPTFEQCKFFFHKGDRCYLFTDGIFEVVDPANEKFVVLGFKKFATLLASVNQMPFDKLIPEIKDRLSSFTYDDDYTLIVFEVTNDCPRDIKETFPGFNEKDVISFITLTRFSDTDEAFATLFGSMAHLKFPAEDQQRAKLTLNELVANAFIHGNKSDPNREISVSYTLTKSLLRTCVVDQGEGFDINALQDPTDAEKLTKEGGRGIFLVKRYTDSLSQNAKGNGVYFTIRKREKAT
jgi:sigma-B regulation protein RsbU (phosphoserine phosphatase)